MTIDVIRVGSTQDPAPSERGEALGTTSVLGAIRDRRSIRLYEARPVEPAKVEALLEAARLAPSFVNRQPFRALVVSEPAGLAALRQAAYGIGAPTTAPLAIVCLTVDSEGESVSERVGELFETGALDNLDGASRRSASGREFRLHREEDLALVDAAIAIEHMALEAVHQGLGTCWVQNFEHDEVRAHFRLPDHVRLVTILTVGYPAEAPPPRPRRRDIRFVPS